MKAEKLITTTMTTTEQCEIDIEEILLLSKEEYAAAKGIIPAVDEWWWLRSPGDFRGLAAIVSDVGSLRYYYVGRDYGCVRPALRIRNLRSSLTRRIANIQKGAS